MKPVFIILLLSAALAMSAAHETAERPMTVDDALNVVRLKNIRLSPDGSTVFYSKETLNWAENKYISTHYLCAGDGNNKRVFLRKGLEAHRFDFSPDGKYLSFTAKPGKENSKKSKAQIYLIPVDGGEAQPLTAHAEGVQAYRWLPDGSGLVFRADEPRSEKDQKEYRLGADAVYVDEAPNGKETARFSRLLHFNLETKKTTVICKEKRVIRDFDISPDGKKIVFVGRPDTRTNYPFLAELYVINLNGAGFSRLTFNKGPETDPKWSPDGKRIIFHAPYQTVKDGTFDLRIGYFWLYDVKTGVFRRLDSHARGEIYGGAQTWSPDGKYFYFNELHGTDTNLYRMDVKKDALTALTRVTGTLIPRGFSAGRETMVYTFEDARTPADIYVSDLRLKKPVRITDANPGFHDKPRLAEAKPIRWKSSKDGMEIEGLFYFPPAVPKGKKVPLLVHIHGGPAGVTENRFRADLQVYCGLGYAVLGPNYRGSTGYGDELLRGLMGEVGDGEHADIMSGVDHVLAHYAVDPERMVVRGWSWGGVSTGFLVTHVHRFKAACAGAGVFNWAAEVGPGFSYDVSLWYIGGAPWDNPKEWAKRSAITYTKQVKTPLLLLHGGSDTTSSVNQSLMYFTALRDIGKAPVRYIKFPRQGHGIDEPRLKRISLTEEIKWFDKYID